MNECLSALAQTADTVEGVTYEAIFSVHVRGGRPPPLPDGLACVAFLPLPPRSLFPSSSNIVETNPLASVRCTGCVCIGSFQTIE